MRCNCGVDPKLLTDQWLIAEQVELLMLPGMLRRLNYKPRSPIPEKFTLGKGHMLFWVDKLKYLRHRHDEIKKEVSRRGFKVTDREIDLSEFPEKFINDWKPTLEDSMILRERLIWKLNRKPIMWRYERVNIRGRLEEFKKELLESECYKV